MVLFARISFSIRSEPRKEANAYIKYQHIQTIPENNNKTGTTAVKIKAKARKLLRNNKTKLLYYSWSNQFIVCIPTGI